MLRGLEERVTLFPDAPRGSPELVEKLKARLGDKLSSRLGWQPRWRLADALQHIVTWHQAWLDKQDVRALCLQQIAQYTHDSKTLAS